MATSVKRGRFKEGLTKFGGKLKDAQFAVRNRWLASAIRGRYSVSPRNLDSVLSEARQNMVRDGKRILLVYPSKGQGISTAYGEAIPLALLHRQKEAKLEGWNPKIVNLAAEKNPFQAIDRAVREHRPQVIGFSTTSPSEAMALSLAKHLRANGLASDKLLIKGGPGTQYSFQQINKVLGDRSPIDAFFLGDADASFRPFLKAVELGQGDKIGNFAGISLAGKGEKQALGADISKRAFPDAPDILQMGEHAFPVMLYPPKGDLSHVDVERMGRIQTMTKCAFGCSFCDVSNLIGAQTRISVKEAASHIREMVKHGINVFYFEDATFLVDRIKSGAFTHQKDIYGNVIPGQKFSGWTKEFLSEMKTLKAEEEKKGKTIRFGIQTRLDSLDNETIREIAEAGCTNVFLGIETLGKPALTKMHKGTLNEETELKRIFTNLRRNGINPTSSLIVGKYTGGIDNFEYTLKKLNELGTSEIFLQAAAVYPGTGDWKTLSPAESSHVTLSYLAPGHVASGVSRRGMNPEDRVQYNKWDWRTTLRKYYKIAPRILGGNFVQMNPGHYLRREIYETVR